MSRPAALIFPYLVKQGITDWDALITLASLYSSSWGWKRKNNLDIGCILAGSQESFYPSYFRQFWWNILLTVANINFHCVGLDIWSVSSLYERLGFILASSAGQELWDKHFSRPSPEHSKWREVCLALFQWSLLFPLVWLGCLVAIMQNIQVGFRSELKWVYPTHIPLPTHSAISL